APALLRIIAAGEGVGDGIDIRADFQPQVLEIIAGIADDRQLVGGQHTRQPQRQLGAADTPGQGENLLLAHSACPTAIYGGADGITALAPPDNYCSGTKRMSGDTNAGCVLCGFSRENKACQDD